jgi:hypothetical protein
MELSHAALDILNCIRLNGYEVSISSNGNALIITIFDLERDAVSTYAITRDTEASVAAQMSNAFCTEQQREKLFVSAGGSVLLA